MRIWYLSHKRIRFQLTSMLTNPVGLYIEAKYLALSLHLEGLQAFCIYGSSKDSQNLLARDVPFWYHLIHVEPKKFHNRSTIDKQPLKMNI